jgi:hypothetical protein
MGHLPQDVGYLAQIHASKRTDFVFMIGAKKWAGF